MDAQRPGREEDKGIMGTSRQVETIASEDLLPLPPLAKKKREPNSERE
jgi:hypothetical protein